MFRFVFTTRMLSARSGAGSEPQPPRSVRADSRPSSSYEYRKPPEEPEKPGPEVVECLAESLGISLDSQLSFQWIVTDCLLRLVESGWKCEVAQDGQSKSLVFHHSTTSEKRSVHEIVETHRELARRIVYEHDELEAKRNDFEYRIKELVYQRLLAVGDSRQMAVPCVIEKILQLLKVDVLSESYLARVVREEMDSAYFRVQDLGGGHMITVETCLDVKQLYARIAHERIGYMKKLSKSKLLFCVECRQTLADGMCSTCGDCLCACCHSRLHSKGSRQDHLFVFLEQCICAECELLAADIRCVDCADLFCSDCFRSTHTRGKRTKHCVQLALTLYCFNCDFKEANLICLECHDALCSSCSCRVHSFHPQRNHQFYGVRGIAYPRKLFAGNIDSLNAVILKCHAYKKQKHWYLMHDTECLPYWYNFYSGSRVKCIDNDIWRTPSESPEMVEEIDRVTTSRAIERAVFEVPSSVKIHFRPQVRI